MVKLTDYNREEQLELLANILIGNFPEPEDGFLESLTNFMMGSLTISILPVYLELLENFIKKKTISAGEFSVQFIKIYESLSHTITVLQTNLLIIDPTNESIKFGEFIINIQHLCLEYKDLGLEYQNPELSLNIEFTNKIEDLYIKINDFNCK